MARETNTQYIVEHRVRRESQQHKFFSRGDVILIKIGSKKETASKNCALKENKKKMALEDFESLKSMVCEDLIRRIAGQLRVRVVSKPCTAASLVILTNTLDEEIEEFLNVFFGDKDIKTYLNKSYPIKIISGKKYIKLLQTVSNKEIIDYARGVCIGCGSCRSPATICSANKTSAIAELVIALENKYPGRAQSLFRCKEKLREILC